jgi:hypothetical protein
MAIMVCTSSFVSEKERVKMANTYIYTYMLSSSVYCMLYVHMYTHVYICGGWRERERDNNCKRLRYIHTKQSNTLAIFFSKFKCSQLKYVPIGSYLN